MSQIFWVGFGWVLCGASAFALTFLARAPARAASRRLAEGEPFRVALRAFAVAFGVVVGYLGRGSLFLGLAPLPAALLGGLAGFGARDAYDAYKAARALTRRRALAALSRAGKERA
jgi:hypothetical protein